MDALAKILEEAHSRGCADLVMLTIAEFNKRDSDRGWRDDATKADSRGKAARSTDAAAGHGTAIK
jgi:hypothetical protein